MRTPWSALTLLKKNITQLYYKIILTHNNTINTISRILSLLKLHLNKHEHKFWRNHYLKQIYSYYTQRILKDRFLVEFHQFKNQSNLLGIRAQQQLMVCSKLRGYSLCKGSTLIIIYSFNSKQVKMKVCTKLIQVVK